MTIFRKVSLLLVLLVAGIYLAVPSPTFPKPPPDSMQSLEEADVEDAQERRAYFTNYTREEILTSYESRLQKSLFFKIPAYVVTYPPEDAQTLIRDQTRSVHLPEIIVPGRESLFVNVFEAKTAKDAISYKGVSYDRKITVRYVPSSSFLRLLIILPAFLFFLHLLAEVLKDTLKTTKSILKK